MQNAFSPPADPADSSTPVPGRTPQGLSGQGGPAGRRALPDRRRAAGVDFRRLRNREGGVLFLRRLPMCERHRRGGLLSFAEKGRRTVRGEAWVNVARHDGAAAVREREQT